MIVDDGLPDYRLEEEPGDIIRVVRTRLVEAPAAPLFGAEVVEELRRIAPGWDPYGLMAEWEAFWAQTGHPRLRKPTAALLAWAQGRVARG
jgi:hypothetical protein